MPVNLRYVLTHLLVFAVCLLAGLNRLAAQRISVELENGSLSQALLQVAEAAELSLSVDAKQLRGASIPQQQYQEEALESVLRALLAPHGLTYQLKSKVLTIQALRTSAPPIVQGFVSDGRSGERLLGATVRVVGTSTGAVTNNFGFYSLPIAEDSVLLEVRYLGYQPQVLVVKRPEQKRLDVSLRPAINLDQVVVLARGRDTSFAERPLQEDESLPSGQRLDLEQITQTPGLLGQPDILRGLTLQPGVVSGPDGIGGLHVRGGTSDQNLVLLDDVPIYQPMHAFGLFSVFSPDLIGDVHFYKEGFPARYEGRGSSVVDVRTRTPKQGEKQRSIHVGTSMARASIGQPVFGDRGSVAVAGRISYLSPVLRVASQQTKREDGVTGELTYQFSDLHVKLHYDLSPKDRFFFTYFNGSDGLEDLSEDSFLEEDDDELFLVDAESQQQLTWSNRFFSLRWNRILGERSFLNLSLNQSRYDYELDRFASFTANSESGEPLFEESIELLQSSQIVETSARGDVDVYLNAGHHLRLGWKLSRRAFEPGLQSIFERDEEFDDEEPEPESTLDSLQLPPIEAYESAVYVEDEYRTRLWRLRAGVRLSMGAESGQQSFNLEPRFLAEFFPHTAWQLRASASSTVQYVQLLSDSDAGLPEDFWVSSGTEQAPPRVHQVSLGANYFPMPGLRLSLAGYAKDLQRVRRLVEDAYNDNQLIDGGNWESFADVGSATLVGLEFGATFSRPRYHVSWAYTWQDADRAFDDAATRYAFDIRHQVQATGDWQFRRGWYLGAAWQYASPRKLTDVVLPPDRAPLRFLLGEADIPAGTTRFPAYHRLDLNLRHDWGTSVEHSLRLSVFNAYDRANPLYSLRNEGLSSSTTNLTYHRGLPLMPSLSYDLRW